MISNGNFLASSILSAHQPNFLPWLGYFSKINQSHIFVFSDDVRYSKQQNISRATFLDEIGNEFFWQIPIKKNPSGRIYEKLLCHEESRVFDRGASKLRNEYKKAPFYNDLLSLIDQIELAFYSIKHIAEFNIFCIKLIANYLKIESIFLKGSDYGLQDYSANERLLFRAKVLGIPTYLCGQGASGYQDDRWLNERGMDVRYVNYSELDFYGDDLRHSILHLIALYGVNSIKNFIFNSSYRAGENADVARN